MWRRILQKTFPYISPIKTALIGAHFGGFLSIYTLANDPTAVFGCSVAISPVSSWMSLGIDGYTFAKAICRVSHKFGFYAAAPYAERYLGLLNDRDGQRHYFEADLTTNSKHLHLRDVFLLHGTLEETYTVTHSMLIARSLIEKRFHFQQQVLL